MLGKPQELHGCQVKIHRLKVVIIQTLIRNKFCLPTRKLDNIRQSLTVRMQGKIFQHFPFPIKACVLWQH